jgi:hypothetical protein
LSYRVATHRLDSGRWRLEAAERKTPKDTIQDAPVVNTGNATRFVRKERPYGSPFKVREFIPRDSGPRSGRLNHIQTDAFNQQKSNNSSLPIGYFRAIARSGIFDGLRLCRCEAFADVPGAARGIKRRLCVALELRHHLTSDQFIAARCC